MIPLEIDPHARSSLPPDGREKTVPVYAALPSNPPILSPGSHPAGIPFPIGLVLYY